MTPQDSITGDTALARPRIKEAIGETASNIKSKLGDAVEAGKDRVTEWKGGLETTIQDRPFQSVLIAIGIGAALGVLLGRRFR